MLVVGLTGGIGSGKTTVLNLFKELGVPTYIADVEAKRLMNSSKELKALIVKHFSDESYIDGQLNRKYIAGIVFKNPEKLKVLNSIVHPAVRFDFEEFVKKSTSEYVLYESAILIENLKSDSQFDFIISVIAPESVRIERVLNRDGVSKAEVVLRIKQQISDKERIEKSDFIIENSDLELTKKMVFGIHQQLLSQK